LYYSNGASLELSSEDKNNEWQWSVSPTCPASYEGRISKEAQATLVITSVTVADGGTYGCSLVMASGPPVVSKVQLMILGMYIYKQDLTNNQTFLTKKIELASKQYMGCVGV
jgi:hypothetical protein